MTMTATKPADAPLNEDGYSLEGWIARLDKFMVKVHGLSIHDLPDRDFWSAWSDGITPGEYFREELSDLDDLDW